MRTAAMVMILGNGAAAAQVSDPTYALSLSFGSETFAGTITTDGKATRVRPAHPRAGGLPRP